MSDKQTLQSQITQLKSVLASPKTDGTTRKILESGLRKAEAKLEELEKAEKLESSKKELTPKQEAKVEEVKKETKSLAQTLKEKVKKAKEKIATTTPKATKKGGARSVAKAKEMAKQRRSTQKKQSLSDKDIESDANRFAINKTKRRSQGGRANQYGTKAENKGGVYYEKRENRYDVQNKRYAKLKKGGSLAEKYTFFGTSENGWYVKDKETNKFIRPIGKSVWDSKEDAMKDLKESKFKYEDGGAIQTINGTEFSTEDLSGMFARGGIMEHGLMVGDMIVGTSSDPYSIVVRNNGMEMVVDLNEGTRVSNNQGTRFSSRSMKDPMIVRTQFEEMDFEYADGGAIQSINGTQFSSEDLSGMFLKGGMLNKKVNETIKGYLDDNSASPMHQWEVKTILESALTDANFHKEAKMVDSVFPKANFDSVKYSKTFEDYLTEKLEGMGREIASMSEYDGDQIINAIAFYVSMNMGRPLGQKVESLKNSMSNGGVTNSMEDVNYLKGVSGLRATFIEEWANKNNVDLSKVANAIKTKKLKPIDLSTALSGREGNKYAKDIIQKYSHNKMERGGKSYSKGDSIASAKRVASAMRSKMMKKKS